MRRRGVTFLAGGVALLAAIVPTIVGALRWVAVLVTLVTVVAATVHPVVRELRRRRSQLRGQSVQTINDAVDSRLVSLFTNQERPLRGFERLLGEHGSRLRVLSIHGRGGTGKSWILRYLRYLGHERGHLVSLIDGAANSSPLELLNIVAHDLRAAGQSLPAYEHRVEQHQRVQAQVDKRFGPIESAAKLTLTVGASTLGPSSPLVDPAAQEAFLALIQELLNHNDRELYLNPVESLSAALLDDLNRIASQRPVLLLIDTYERLTELDSWLRHFVERLSNEVRLVIAGQIHLAKAWDEFRPLTLAISLEEFDPRASRECLRRYASEYLNIDLPPDQQESIVAFAGGLPLAISWCVDLMARYSVTDFREVQSEVVAQLARTMLEVAPAEIRILVESCAIPRWLNEDLLSHLNETWDARTAYEALSQLPFVRVVPEGLTLHDQVRQFTHEILRHRSPDRYAAIHSRCADFHRSRLTDSILSPTVNPSVERRSAVELLYHTLMVNEREGFRLLSELIGEGLELSRLEYCEALLLEAKTHDLTSDARQWIQYWTAEIAYRRGNWFDALSVLRTLLQEASSGHPIYVPTCVTLGRVYYQHGRIQEAASVYDEALRHLGERSMGLRGYITEQLAKVRRMGGELNTALELHEDALEYSKAVGNRYAIASGFGSRGTTLLLLGRLQEGADSLERGVNASREAGYIQFACSALRSRAIGLTYLGQYREAARNAAESLEIARRIGDTFNQGFAHLALAEVHLRTRLDLRVCASELAQALDDFRTVGAKFDLGNCHMALGNLHILRHDPVSAERAFDDALELFSATAFRYGLAWLAYYRARLWSSLERFERAIEDATSAREEAEAIGAVYVASWARLQFASGLIHHRGVEASASDALSAIEDSRLLGYNDIAAEAHLLRAEIVGDDPQRRDQLADAAYEALSYAARHSVVTFARTASEVAKLCRQAAWDGIGDELLRRWMVHGVDGMAGPSVESQLKQNLPDHPFTTLRQILT